MAWTQRLRVGWEESLSPRRGCLWVWGPAAPVPALCPVDSHCWAGGILAVCSGTLPLWGTPGEVQGLGGKLSWWLGDPQSRRSDQSVPHQGEPQSLMTPDCESVLGHRRVSPPSYLCCLPPAGLIGPVTLDKIPLDWFTIYSLELKMRFFKKYLPSNPNPNPDPDPGLDPDPKP